MSTAPAPTWPIEPTILYIVLYYPTNGVDEEPSAAIYNMRDLETATAAAKQLILDAGNAGVCVISQVSGIIVYPSIPWQAF